MWAGVFAFGSAKVRSQEVYLQAWRKNLCEGFYGGCFFTADGAEGSQKVRRGFYTPKIKH